METLEHSVENGASTPSSNANVTGQREVLENIEVTRQEVQEFLENLASEDRGKVEAHLGWIQRENFGSFGLTKRDLAGVPEYLAAHNRKGTSSGEMGR